ncbi:MAG TPA: glycosyltransferase family 9 protein [Candidatus Limnocylindrales bacterium]|nr:glycosyltransferase family 9 protein [Candidatus Limnocylindrales bacterium]
MRQLADRAVMPHAPTARDGGPAPRPGDTEPAPAPAAPLPAEMLVPRGGRICLFRALPGIGDLLCAVPAFRAIRTARPDVSVTLVTLPAVAELAARYEDYLDEVLPFPGFPGLPDRRPDVPAIPTFLGGMHERRFDLAIQLHGAGDRTNDVVRLFGARRSAGFHPRGETAPEPARYLPWVEAEHEIVRWLRLVGHLGIAGDDTRLELPVAPDADTQGEAVLAEALPPRAGRPLVIVHPGASAALRRWPARGFATVVDRLVAEGADIVLTGQAGERPLTALVRSLVAKPERVADLAGRTSLDELAGILRRADLLVANDTGVSHVAAALGTPSVVVFVGTDPVRWAPLDTTRHHAVSGGSARRVADEAARMLRRRRSDAA